MEKTSQITLLEARKRAYQLFSNLYFGGLTPKVFHEVSQIPLLKKELPDSFDANEWAVIHQNVLGFEVFPYASIFLEDALHVGGETTETVWEYYHATSFELPTLNESADHIGNELAYLAYLCEAEQQARAKNAHEFSHFIQTEQNRFITEHLLTWLPVFTGAMWRSGYRFYQQLASLTLDLVADHASVGMPHLNTASSSFTPSNLLEEKETGFKEIATFLCTPSQSGWFLSKQDIGSLSKSTKIPKGFGTRILMLTNLFRSAVTYNEMPLLLESLRQLLEEWESFYESYQNATIDALAHSTKTSLYKLQQVRNILERVQLVAEKE